MLIRVQVAGRSFNRAGTRDTGAKSIVCDLLEDGRRSQCARRSDCEWATGSCFEYPGSIGILGDDYPGYFEVGDTKRLAHLMLQCEADPVFLAEITNRCRALIPLFDPERERASWVSPSQGTDVA
jgi:hypothetical protein